MYLSPEEHGFIDVHCSGCGYRRTIIRPCSKRFCPHCGHIRRWRIRERLYQVLNNYKRQPGYMLKMITLSCANSSDLEQGINHLISSFRRLRQSKLWKKLVLGGITVIEIQGSPGDWHPHLHIFAYSLRYQWKDLLAGWKKASRGGSAVWISNISHHNAVFYVTKYCTKMADVAADCDEPNTAMTSKRMFQRFGSFAGFPLPRHYSSRKCEVCNNTDWLTEWEIKRAEKMMPSNFTRIDIDPPF